MFIFNIKLTWDQKMVLSLQSIPYVQSNHKFVIFVVSKLLFPLFKTLDTTWEIDVANISANHVVLKVFHHSPWSHTVCEEGHRLSTHLRHDIAHSLWLLFADAKTPRHRGCISPFLRTGWQTSSLLALSSWEGTKSWILHPHKEKSRKKHRFKIKSSETQIFKRCWKLHCHRSNISLLQENEKWFIY